MLPLLPIPSLLPTPYSLQPRMKVPNPIENYFMTQTDIPSLRNRGV
ncbi:MAG: hypothetical protein F6K56_16640 [Moorea sp. SIO3G5]|nr:hypothetical protein [Moorena sp. SIO3G5]